MNPKRHLKHIATVTLAAMIAIAPVVSASAATNYPEFGDNSSRTHYNGLSDSGNWNTTATIKSFNYNGQTLSMGAGGGTTGVANGTGIGYAGMYYFPVSAPYDSSTGGDNPSLNGYLTAWNMANGQPTEAPGWPQQIVGVSNSSPLVEGGNVYLAAGSRMYGFYSNGKALPNPPDNIGVSNPVFVNQVVSHPLWVPNDGLIWVSSQNGYLYGVNPTTLLSTPSPSGGGITVKIGSRMDGSPTLVTDTSGTPYIAQGTAYAPGNQGGTGVLYIVSLSGGVVAKYQDPNGVAIASAPINAGGGNIMWNDINGNVYHANLVNTGSGVAIQNVHEWSPTTHPGFTNEEAAYVGGYYVLPQTSSGYIEIVNGSQTSSSSMQEVQIPDAVAVGANNVGSPEASASYIYVSDSYADVTQIPIAKLGNLTMTDMTDLAVTGSTHAANLTSINMNLLPDPQGQSVPTIGFESSAGLTLWQNAATSSITLAATASSATTGASVSLKASAVSVPKGDTVQIAATPTTTPGTLNYGGQTQQNTVATSPYTAFTPSATMDATANSGAAQSVTYVAKIMSSSASSPVAQSSPVTVTWAAPPTLTLSVTPTASQTTGKTFQLTAGTTNAAGDHVVFTQSGSLSNNGGSGTLSGNFESNVPSISYSAQTAASYQYQPTATSSQAGSETVTAALLNSSNQPVTNASGQAITKSVNVTWTAPVTATQSITLAVTPTTSQTVGNSFTLTATAHNITSGEVIQIAEASAPTPGTLGGGTYVQWVSPGNYASYQFHTTAVSSAAQTVSYQASIYPVSGSPIPSNTVSATWTAVVTAPTITISANPTSLAVGDKSQITVNTTNLQAGDRVVIAQTDQSAAGTLSGNFQSNQTTLIYTMSRAYSTFTFSPTAVSQSAATYDYTAQIRNAAGQALVSAGPVSVAWTAATVPTITLSASNTSPTVGQGVQLTAVAQNLPTGARIYIHDLSGADTLDGANVQSGTSNPFATSASSTSAQTVNYHASVFFNGSYIDSNTVSVTWTGSSPPPSSGTLTLSARYTALSSPSSGDSLIATGSGLTSGALIVVTQQNTSGGDTFGSQGQANSSGQYYVEANTPTLGPVRINDVSGASPYTATYSAQAINPSTGQVEATSNTVSVTWTGANPTISLTAFPTSMQSGQSTMITYTVSNMQSGDYVDIQSTGNGHDMWNATRLASSTGSDLEIEFAPYPNIVHVTVSAVVFNASGQPLGVSSIALTWQTPAPTITLTASPTQAVPGQPATIAYEVANWQSGDTVSVTPTTNGNDAWHVSHSVNGSDSYQEIENPGSGQTITTSYTATLYDSAGQSVASATARVTWINAWIPGSITLAANPTLLGAGSPTTLTAQSSAFLPAGYQLDITDKTTGQLVARSDSSSLAAQYTAYGAEAEQFVAYVSDGYEQMGTGLNPVAVQWVGATLTAKPTPLPTGSFATLTATAPGMPAGSWLLIANESNGQVVAESQNTTLTTSQTQTTGQTDTYIAYVSTSANATNKYASSNTATVQWYGVRLTAHPTSLTVGGATTITATTINLPAGYELDLVDETTRQTLAIGTAGATTLSVQQSQAAASTHTYLAFVMKPPQYGYGLWAAVLKQPYSLYQNGSFNWGAETPAGAAVYNRGVWTSVGNPNGDPGITTLAYDKASGTMWAGTAGAGVAYWNGTAWVNAGDPGGHARISQLLYASGGTMWVLTTTGDVGYWSGSAWVMTPFATGLTPVSGFVWTPLSLTDGPGGQVLVLRAVQENPPGSASYQAGVQIDQWNGATWNSLYNAPNVNQGNTNWLMNQIVYDPANAWVYGIGTYRWFYRNPTTKQVLHQESQNLMGISLTALGNSAQIQQNASNAYSPAGVYSDNYSGYQPLPSGTYNQFGWENMNISYFLSPSYNPENISYGNATGALDGTAQILGQPDGGGNVYVSAWADLTTGSTTVMMQAAPNANGLLQVTTGALGQSEGIYYSWQNPSAAASNGQNDYFGWSNTAGTQSNPSGQWGVVQNQSTTMVNNQLVQNGQAIGDTAGGLAGVTNLLWDANTAQNNGAPTNQTTYIDINGQEVYGPSGAVATSNPVAVTWSNQQQQCTAPPGLTVQNNQGQGATIAVSDPSGDVLHLTATGGTLSQTTVTGSATVQLTAASGATGATVTATDATNSGCPSASTSVTWTSWPKPGAPMTFQITDLLADPGTPANLWTPTNKTATQSNHNGSTDGSTIAGGPPLPTYGNPAAHPAVYVRPDSGFGFRALWTGPLDQAPTKAAATYTMTNPDGNWRTWTVTGSVATATVHVGANGSLSEYTFFWTPLPKYTTRKAGNDWWNLELAAWSLTGNPHATISVTVTFYNGLGPNGGSGTWTWTDPNIAQTLGYPMWYYIHQVPNQPIQPGAKVYHLTTPSGTATGNALPAQGMPTGGGALYTPGNTGTYVNPYPAP